MRPGDRPARRRDCRGRRRDPGSEERSSSSCSATSSPSCAAARAVRAGAAHPVCAERDATLRRTSLGLAHEARRCLVRPVSGRGPGRRGARGPGPGRAVRHPGRLGRAEDGELLVDGHPASFRHPADAIRAGLVYVPADRAEALLMQRSVRENIALPFTARLRAGARSTWRREEDGQRRRRTAPDRHPCPGEVRRLSGGNQQKVTIARWVAGGVRTMLCFDPTRGIDIRTKRQIYVLLRDLAEAGAAVLLYTSELKEIQLVCDRAIVIFGGRSSPRSLWRTPTSRRSCAPPTTCRRTRRCRRRSPRPSWPAEGDAEPSTAGGDGRRAMTAAGEEHRRAPASVGNCGAPECLDARPRRRSSWSCSCSPRSSSRATGRPRSRASRSGCCRSRSPRSPRRSSSSQGGSTCRSPRSCR